MNNIHIFTQVKRQSFSDLDKATERKRHNERRRILTRSTRRTVFTRRLKKVGFKNDEIFSPVFVTLPVQKNPY